MIDFNNPAFTTIFTAVVSIFASTGFWAFVQYKSQQKSASNQMLKGLGHDRIICLGEEYIKRGSISKDEFENLHDYLYIPYKGLGGNGTAEKIMKEVDGLPIKEKNNE